MSGSDSDEPKEKIETIDSLKDLTLEDGEITQMLPIDMFDEAAGPSSIPMEYDFDMEAPELKNMAFPAIKKHSDIDDKTQKSPPQSPKKLKARRKIDFDDTKNTQLKVSIRLKKLKEIRDKTNVTKAILAHRKLKVPKTDTGSSNSQSNDDYSEEEYELPCTLGEDVCFICKSRKSQSKKN